MSKVAILRWRWQPAGPLVTGYSQNLAEAAGEIERGQRSVINLKTRDETGRLVPSFLASSVKGVFRTAAAWLVERTARQLGADAYVTCDYGLAVPEGWRAKLGVRKREGLCPVCQVFGGSGCLGESDVAPATRLKSPVSFGFDRADDGTHGTAKDSPSYRFAWEQIESRGKKLVVEQLQFEDGVTLEARVEPAGDFAVALLLLAADLVGSGFFRFGRFTTRGYGVVRLEPAAYLMGGLDVLLAGDRLEPEPVEAGQGTLAVAQKMLGRGPLDVIQAGVEDWMR